MYVSVDQDILFELIELAYKQNKTQAQYLISKLKLELEYWDEKELSAFESTLNFPFKD